MRRAGKLYYKGALKITSGAKEQQKRLEGHGKPGEGLK
jgi:hypothetical protein